MQPVGSLIGTRIQLVGKRICDNCGDTVPIYQRDDKRVSVCMNCENQKLRDQLPKKEDVEKLHLKKFIEKQEVIPEQLQNETFDTYKPRHESQVKAKKICQRYADTFGNFEKYHSLVIQGNPGLGKSHLSLSVHKEVRAKGYLSLFIDVPSLMKLIKSTYSDYSTLTEKEIMEHLEQLDLLVLDDVGAEYVKVDPNGYESWAADILFHIVNSRQDKPTIFTTNYSSKELKEKYGLKSPRILSRMNHGAFPINLQGKDYRLGGEKDVQR